MIFAVLTAMAIAAAPESDRESSVDFTIDEALLARGGVQFFLELTPVVEPLKEGSTVSRFMRLDGTTAKAGLHALMGRVVYDIDRDISFFTEKRARDITYIQRLAPEMGVKSDGDGSFRVSKTPGNRFTIQWFDAPSAQQQELTGFFPFIVGSPHSVAVQRNSEFARVLGFRTAERSVTFTAHVPIAPGKTRVQICTLSLLVNLPPAFLGGSARVERESIEGTQQLIKQLREYDGE